MFQYSFKIQPDRLKLIRLYPCWFSLAKYQFRLRSSSWPFCSNSPEWRSRHIVTWFGRHGDAFGTTENAFISCIYDPQITVSPTSSFSASFNGNRVQKSPLTLDLSFNIVHFILFNLYYTHACTHARMHTHAHIHPPPLNHGTSCTFALMFCMLSWIKPVLGSLEKCNVCSDQCRQAVAKTLMCSRLNYMCLDFVIAPSQSLDELQPIRMSQLELIFPPKA